MSEQWGFTTSAKSGSSSPVADTSRSGQTSSLSLWSRTLLPDGTVQRYPLFKRFSKRSKLEIFCGVPELFSILELYSEVLIIWSSWHQYFENPWQSLDYPATFRWIFKIANIWRILYTSASTSSTLRSIFCKRVFLLFEIGANDLRLEWSRY